MGETLKLYLDQMIPSEVARELQGQGYDVLRASETGQNRADERPPGRYSDKPTRPNRVNRPIRPKRRIRGTKESYNFMDIPQCLIDWMGEMDAIETVREKGLNRVLKV